MVTHGEVGGGGGAGMVALAGCLGFRRFAGLVREVPPGGKFPPVHGGAKSRESTARSGRRNLLSIAVGFIGPTGEPTR